MVMQWLGHQTHDARYTHTHLHHQAVSLPKRDYATFGSLLLHIRRLSVTSVRPAQGVASNFLQYFFAVVYLSHPLTSVKNFTAIV